MSEDNVFLYNTFNSHEAEGESVCVHTQIHACVCWGGGVDIL